MPAMRSMIGGILDRVKEKGTHASYAPNKPISNIIHSRNGTSKAGGGHSDIEMVRTFQVAYIREDGDGDSTVELVEDKKWNRGYWEGPRNLDQMY